MENYEKIKTIRTEILKLKYYLITKKIEVDELKNKLKQLKADLKILNEDVKKLIITREQKKLFNSLKKQTTAELKQIEDELKKGILDKYEKPQRKPKTKKIKNEY